MVDEFDPYLSWLDIGRHQRPVEPHRLLGLPAGETDAATITAAAERVVRHLQQFATGEYAQICRRVIDEVYAARDRLIGPKAKPYGGAPVADLQRDTGVRIKPPTGLPWELAPSGMPEPRIGAPPPVPGRGPAMALPASPAPSIRAAPPVPGSMTAPAPSVPIVIPVGSLLSSPPVPMADAPTVVPAEQIHQPPGIGVGPSAGPEGDAAAWIPAGRTGNIGVSAAAATDYGDVEHQRRANSARLLRRKSRRQNNVLWSLILIVGICVIVAVSMVAVRFLHSL